jgi:hypothetical protein
MKKFSAVTARKVVGLDLGDRHSQLVGGALGRTF